MTSTFLLERPSQGLVGTLDDLARFAGELLRPRLVEGEALAMATTVAFPGLVGILPGVGRFAPLDWGLGFEIRDGKAPHWMGTTNDPRTFGHFGGSGTFLWVDPTADLALVCLTDRDYGSWALEAWPGFSDEILAAALEERRRSMARGDGGLGAGPSVADRYTARTNDRADDLEGPTR
jgi:CubicO group peptidase (beta-lactamase class C family)